MKPRFPAVWNATEAEVAACYACDGFAPQPDLMLWRALDVDAPAALVYRWVQQLKVAPYSYDLIDNRGRRSPRRLVPEAEDVAVGQRVMGIFRIVAVDAGRQLTVGPSSRAGVSIFGEVHITYAVKPRSDATSRIVVKVCCSITASAYARVYLAALPLLDYVMMRKQLLTLRALAERDARRE